MTRGSWSTLLLATALTTLACEGREVMVFDLPAKLGGAGTSGAAGASGGAGAAGMMTAPPSGASSGGSLADSGGVGGGGSQSGGSSASDVGGALGTAGTAPTPCTSKADCSPGWTCDKKDCQAPMGECVPYPPICPPNPAPVCGCDGVTYWNDCIRLQGDATLAAPDQCRATACTCEVGADCKVPYASCSHLLAPGEMCGHAMGNCWVLPPQCEGTDSKMWHECKPPDPGIPAKCVNTCDAIASEHSYAELHRGDTCN